MKLNGILRTLCNCQMKKLVGLGLAALLAFSLIPFGSVAQESRQERFERIEAEKVAFITKELDLTSREAQRFFPAYNEYRKELYAMLEADRRKLQDNGKKQTRMDELERETKILAIKKKYRDRFTDIVGQARASRFFEAEREFREKLMQELRRRGN